MNKLTDKIADARRLDAEATPGPWVRFHDLPTSDGSPHPCDCGQIWGRDDLLFCPARDVDDKHVERKEDGRLIVHARNHHAALWDCAEVLSQLVAEALAVSRMQARGYGMQGKLRRLRSLAKDGAAALARLEQVQP